MTDENDMSALRGWFDGVCDVYETQYDFALDVSYISGDFFDDVAMLANIMSGNDDDFSVGAPCCEGLTFEFTCGPDGQIGGAEVQLHLSVLAPGLYLSKWLEDKYLTDDRSTSGVEGAWAVVTCLYREFQNLKIAADGLARV